MKGGFFCTLEISSTVLVICIDKAGGLVACPQESFRGNAVVYFLVDLLMDGEILKDLESTLIYDAMFFLPN